MKNTTICKIAAPVLLGSVLFASGSALAVDISGTNNTAVIDGHYSDWDLGNDLSFPMHEAGDIPAEDNIGKDLFSNAYLRYDCNTKTMFVLVLDQDIPDGSLLDDGYYPVNEADNAWVKMDGFNSNLVDGTENNNGSPTGNPPEFSWVAPDGEEQSTLLGWEGSFKLSPGYYTGIEIHVNMNAAGDTSSTGKKPYRIPLNIQCPDTPPILIPGITIKKATNGKNSDVAPGENIAEGSPVAWTYTVKNTGNLPLDNVTVTDSKGENVTCPATVLAVGIEMTCTANGSVILGSYSNIGTVTGTYEGGSEPVTDEDSSYYTGTSNLIPAPAIDIETSTNGHDADLETGPTLLVGQPVNWEYVVTNTGNVSLTNISVIDNDDIVVDCGDGGNIIASLSMNESITCSATGPVTAGQYANKGCVEVVYDADGNVVYDANGNKVADCDPSHYFGADPQLDIETHTQGFDADDPTGPYIEENDPAYWLYSVTNTGNVPLTNIAVTDDQGVVVNCGDDSDTIAELQPGASFNCSGTGTATVGQYENLGTAESDFTDYEGDATPPVTASDPSHYFGVDPGIDIETCTSGSALDACLENDPSNHDSPFGAAFLEGETVIWTYTITNTGNVSLNNIIVTDDQGVIVDCGSFDGTLDAAGATVTCTGSGTAVLDGQYRNEGSVIGEYTVIVDENGTPEDRTAEDMDPSHYYAFSTEQPSIELSVRDFEVEGYGNQFNNGTFIVENASGDEEVTALLVQNVDINIAYRVSRAGKGKKIEWTEVDVHNTCTTTPTIPFVVEGPGETVDQADRGQQAFEFNCTAEAGEIPDDYSSVRATVCVQIFNRYDKVKGKVTEDAKWFCSSSDM